MTRRKGSSFLSTWRRLFVPSPQVKERTRQGFIYLLTAIVAGGATWGTLEIKESMESSQVFYLDQWRLDFQEFPEWMTPEIIEEIRDVELRDSEGRLCLHDKGVLARFRDRLLEIPWIRSVTDIRLRYPTSSEQGAISAKIAYRRPVAILHVGESFYLSAADGMRVGGTYRSHPEETSLREWFGVPVITGIQGPIRIPEPGEFWTARDALEGLRVARLLYGAGIHHRFRHRPIELIDVSNLDGRLQPGDNEVELHCAGLILEWGRTSGSSHRAPLEARHILENLITVLSLGEREFRALEGRKVKLYFHRIVYETA